MREPPVLISTTVSKCGCSSIKIKILDIQDAILVLTHSPVAHFSRKTYYFPHVVMSRLLTTPRTYISTPMQPLDIEKDSTDILGDVVVPATVSEFEIFNKAVDDFIFDDYNKVTFTLEAAALTVHFQRRNLFQHSNQRRDPLGKSLKYKLFSR